MIDLFSDIVKRCRQGDRKAQEAIYNLLAGKMFAVCLRYCRNYEQAKDLLHDGFITLYTKIGQYNYSGSFEGWVRRIFVNHVLQWYRNNAKMKMVDHDGDSDNFFISLEGDIYEDKAVSNQLSESELLAIVDSLPKQYKMVFNLYAIDGMSHREIAMKLGISESTSRSNLLRARSIMQKQVLDTINSIPIRKNAIK